MDIGYHASHEQFTPQHLLECVRHAEQAGFSAAMCSDHLQPWSHAQGQSGHAWVWLGAALASTSLRMGVVNAPVGRYHPVEIAQAVASLECMFPERFWLCVGSGEALNECVTGVDWPDKPQRNARLLEAVDAMRALWRGECIDHDGAFTMRKARLFTRPTRMPKIVLAALTPETAKWGGAWADGLLTLGGPTAPVREVIEAFRDGGGHGKPVHVQVKLSYARREDEARMGALEQWRTNVVPPSVSECLRTPEDFERAARDVDVEAMARAVHISADSDAHVEALRRYQALGADGLYLHNVNRAQMDFIDDFGRRVLPRLR